MIFSRGVFVLGVGVIEVPGHELSNPKNLNPNPGRKVPEPQYIPCYTMGALRDADGGLGFRVVVSIFILFHYPETPLCFQVPASQILEPSRKKAKASVKAAGLLQGSWWFRVQDSGFRLQGSDL